MKFTLIFAVVFLRGIVALMNVSMDSLYVEGSSSYASNIRIREASSFIASTNFVQELTKDSPNTSFSTSVDGLILYTESIIKGMTKWLDSKDVAGRRGVMENLQNLMERGTKIGCLLGPQFAGKTTVTKHLQNVLTEHGERTVLFINLKENPGLDVALRKAVKELLQINPTMISRFTKGVESPAKLASLLATFGAAVKRASYLFRDPNDLVPAVNDLVDAIFEKGESLSLASLLDKLRPDKVTVIIDDAQNFFVANDNDKNKNNITATRDALDMLGNRTCQHGPDFSVLFISSDLSYPDKLANELQFDVDQFATFYYLGERGPQEMLGLLTQWGVGPHLARVLISIYGGDINTMTEAIYALKIAIAHEGPLSFASALEWQDVQRIDDAANEILSLRPEVAENIGTFVRCLIRRGHTNYSPGSSVAPFATLLASMNILAIVPPHAEVPDYPDALPQHQRILILISESELGDEGEGVDGAHVLIARGVEGHKVMAIRK